jgi:predicted RNA-binding Zn ribbon-like protein
MKTCGNRHKARQFYRRKVGHLIEPSR